MQKYIPPTIMSMTCKQIKINTTITRKTKNPKKQQFPNIKKHLLRNDKYQLRHRKSSTSTAENSNPYDIGDLRPSKHGERCKRENTAVLKNFQSLSVENEQTAANNSNESDLRRTFKNRWQFF